MRGFGVYGENFVIFCGNNSKVNKLNALGCETGKKRRLCPFVSFLKSVSCIFRSGTIGN